MKHSIKPYSKDISEVYWAFYKSTKYYLIPAWFIKIKMKTKCKRCSKIAHIAWTKRIRKHTDTCWRKRGCLTRIPKIRCLSLLEYLLGVPRASPSFSSCLSLFLHPSWSYPKLENFNHTKVNKDFVRSVSIMKQITTLSTVANPFIFCFCIVATV